MDSSRRDLLNDTAEHRSIFENNQNTHYSLIFQDRAMLSHINGKLSPKPFERYAWTVDIGLSWKNPKYVLPPFWFHTQNTYSIPQNGGFDFPVY